MPHSVNGVWQWDALATKLNEPNVNIVPWSPRTDWWHADSKPSGKGACEISPLPRPNSNDGNDNVRACRAKKRKRKFSLSVPICTKSGERQPPRIGIANSFY